MFAKQFIQISSSIWLISASFSLISVSSPVCISSLCKQHQVSIVEDCILSGLPASPLWFRVNILFNEIKWACLSASLSLFLLSMLKCPFSLSPLTSLLVSFLARKQHVEIISNELVSWLSLLGFMYDGSTACSGFDMHKFILWWEVAVTPWGLELTDFSTTLDVFAYWSWIIMKSSSCGEPALNSTQ